MLIWSTGFVVARYGMPHAPPLGFIAWRHGLSLVAFADAGTLFDSTGHGSFGVSAGLGLLWRSPIGPVRLDLAFTRDGERHVVFGILGGVF